MVSVLEAGSLWILIESVWLIPWEPPYREFYLIEL